jgi:hypothetical protein
MAKTELTIVMPGMAAILSQEINRNTIPPYLTKLISKATMVEKVEGLSRSLFNHFSESPLTSSDLPICDVVPTNGMIIKADPCYLHVDRDRLLLFAKGITLTEQESAELIGEVQPLMSEIGELKLISANSWQLGLKQAPDIQFSALEEVEGKGVDAYLPVGEDRRQWLSLWNEIQMQLYNADLNQHRLASRQLPVNSVWFWGMGDFVPTQTVWKTVSGQSELLTQLVATNPSASYQAEPPEAWSSGKNLWLLKEVDTESDWQTTLQDLDQTVFEPLWQQLSKAAVDKVILEVPQFAEYHITPYSRWRFWR